MTKKLTNIFFCTSFSALLTMTFSSPLPAAEEPPVEDIDPVSLYFDMDTTEQTSTRNPKPLSQVAENVSIITAEEIERMNAHSVDEVLNRINGLYVGFSGRDFNAATSSIHIQDSDYSQVLVLVDGVRWNWDLDGMAVTNTIPVEIIDRIEVIKGPASSTWGSSLGGVVNIITKSTGKSSRPHGTLYGSYGEANSQHYSGSVDGKLGTAGYFLSVASQNSDGINFNRGYDNESVYGKMDFTLPHNTTLTLLAGQSNPWNDLGDLWNQWGDYIIEHRDVWASAALDTSLTNNIDLHIDGYRKTQKFIYPTFSLDYEPETTGVSSRLTARLDSHTIVMGAEIDRVETESSDPTYDDLKEENWGVYINDTFTAGPFSVTPGIRYDHLSLTDNVLSPSLGMTWQYTEKTLFRALFAKGFRKPYLVDAEDADLDPEKVTSYQAGFETRVVPSLVIKASLFEHNLKDKWLFDYTNWRYDILDKVRHYGYELAVATDPFYYFSLDAGIDYTYTDYYGYMDNDDIYSVKLTLLYDNPQLFTAELFSRYQWLNKDKTDDITGLCQDGTMIWDFNIIKKFQLYPATRLDVFMSAHNLFNGADYWNPDYPNARRWVEAGLRFHF